MPMSQGNLDLSALEDCLCFAVYSANLAYRRACEAVLDELGVTYTQWIAIVALGENDGQTVGGLGERLFLKSNTLTPILKNLESHNYLVRKRDPADERRVILSLTATGCALREKIAQHTLLAMTGLTLDEISHLKTSVNKVRDNLLRNLGADQRDHCSRT